MEFFQNMSIKQKLIAIMMLSGIPILFAFFYFIGSQYRSSVKAAEHRVLMAVDTVAFEHTSQVEGIRNLLVALSLHPEIRAKDAAGCSKLLNTILEKSPSSMNVGVADRDGRVVATGIPQPLPITWGVGDRKYFKDALATKRFSSGEYTVSRAARKPTPTLHFGMPVLDRAGEMDLALFVALDLARFSKIFDAQHLPKGAALNITDRNGLVLYRYPQTDVAGLVGRSDIQELRGKMTGALEEGVFYGVGIDGAQRLFAFRRMRLNANEEPYLYIRVSIPEEAIMSGSYRLLGTSVTVFLLAALLTYYLTRRIAQRHFVAPINQLVTASKEVQGGDLSARSGLPYTIDEIGQLAESFDSMTVSLEHRVQEINLAEAEKHRLAFYDPLTGLGNRRLLQDRLALALDRSPRQGTSVALLYIDLDNFKVVNDTFGHIGGDRLLKEMADRFLSLLRKDDVICRIGGDEFAVILHDVDPDDDVTAVLGKLLSAVSAPWALDEKELMVSASIGAALYPRDALDADTLAKYSDMALYQAKSKGKNTFRLFSEELNRLSHERIILTDALRQALERNELVLHYQPKINFDSGRVSGVEALLRWHSPEFGLVMPDRFIPIAEESMMIIEIGEWVLGKACAQQVAWKSQGLDLTVAVNLSAVQFRSASLAQRVQSIIEETDIVPEQLELELTESCLVDDPEETIKVLGALRKLRCQIAIDDFGTGYSSLSYLKNFPVTILKIDRSFVRDLTGDSGERAIAQSVVDLANNLKMTTVAEGVELPEQQKILKDIGCQFCQGHLYSEAVPAESIPGIVRRRMVDAAPKSAPLIAYPPVSLS